MAADRRAGLRRARAVRAARPRADGAPAALRDELAVLARPQVLLGLAMTVLGFAGVFAVFTYVAAAARPPDRASPTARCRPILLLFGGGLAVGNLLGGRLADRGLMPARARHAGGAGRSVLGARGAFAIGSAVPAVVVRRGCWASPSFATVAPLQLRVLEKAAGAGQNLASSLNIAAFNLGNAHGRLGRRRRRSTAGRALAVAAAGWRRCSRSPAWASRCGAARSIAALRPAAGLHADEGLTPAFHLRKEENTMEYRFLGRSGFKVPALGFGAGTFGGTGPAVQRLGQHRRGRRAAHRRHLPRRRRDAVRHAPTSTRTAPRRAILGAALKGRRDAGDRLDQAGAARGRRPQRRRARRATTCSPASMRRSSAWAPTTSTCCNCTPSMR